VSRSGEFDWISRYLAPLSGPTSFGLKDDAALLDAPDGKAVVVTQDAIAESVHFLPGDPPDQVARKALRVNISDIVAKGAMPFAYSLALGVPDRWQDEDMALFCQGLADDQQQYGLNLSGGDTYRSPAGLTVAVTMFGAVEQDEYKSRIGAVDGDVVVVSGCIGDAALGLKVATGELNCPDTDRAALLRAYRLPDPPAPLAGAVARFASASMDISDGLIGDCRKLCVASSVSAKIDRTAIPLSDPAQRLVEQDQTLWQTIISGGDDYQVLATVAPSRLSAFQICAEQCALSVHPIGVITNGKSGSVTLDIDGDEVSIGDDSFSHF